MNRFVVCISNEGYEAALEPRKIYRALEDPVAEERGLIRVVDESEEDYLYSVSMFEVIEVPERLVKAMALAS